MFSWARHKNLSLTLTASISRDDEGQPVGGVEFLKNFVCARHRALISGPSSCPPAQSPPARRTAHTRPNQLLTFGK